jgi:oligopeptidase A
MADSVFRLCSQPPRFDVITPTLAAETLPALLAEGRQAVAALEKCATPTWDGFLIPLHLATKPLWYAWGIVGHELSVMNSQEWRDVDNRFRPEIVNFGLEIGQNPAFYRLMEEMQNGPEWQRLDETRRRILTTALRNARQAGVGLEGAAQKEFNDIQKRLAELSTRFSDNVLDATKAFEMVLADRAEIAGLPGSAVRQAAASAVAAGHAGATPETGPWRITLDIPSYLPFMKYADRRDLRERLQRAFITRAAFGDYDNRPLMVEILALKRRSANLLGYSTHAQISLENKMAGTVAAADRLLAELLAASRTSAEKELAELRGFARQEGCADELMNWDVAYWAEKQRTRLYDYDEEALRPYFQLPKVLDGMFELASRLFGITIQTADGEAPVWHPDVRFFNVLNGGGEKIACFYLDPYSRPATKRGGAWMNGAVGREKLPGCDLQIPVTYLVCNQTPPEGGKPSLMTFLEVTTLFHEFGHGLQHMLTTIDEPDAAGINNIEWDAVELASQFMENWCFHKPTLLSMTAHVDTGAPLPEAIFDKVYAARNFRAASNLLRQCHLSMLDLELYERFIPGGPEPIEAAIERINRLATIMPPLPEDQFLCSFTHIFSGGYSAGYYSYKWSEVLSADAFSAFEEAGLHNPAAVQAAGRRYRDTVLALGGSRHPMEVFTSFRGREPRIDALLRHQGLR